HRVRRRRKARALPRRHRVGRRARRPRRVTLSRSRAHRRRREAIPSARRNPHTMNLTPAIVRDACTGAILTLAYMSEESLAKTIETGETWFWSRSRNELWHKGATSGNTQRVIHIAHDCDDDALVVTVEPRGPA